MPWILFGILVVLALVWGLASISQSYTVAQQAQAAIEASRATQIASLGNLIAIGVLVLLVLVLLACLYFVLKIKTGSVSVGRIPADPLPALLTMLVYQMLQQQQPTQLPTADPELVSDDLLHDLWMS